MTITNFSRKGLALYAEVKDKGCLICSASIEYILLKYPPDKVDNYQESLNKYIVFQNTLKEMLYKTMDGLQSVIIPYDITQREIL